MDPNMTINDHDLMYNKWVKARGMYTKAVNESDDESHETAIDSYSELLYIENQMLLIPGLRLAPIAYQM